MQTCSDIRALLGAYLDQELDAIHNSRVDAHLNTCAACQAQYQADAALHAALKQATYFSAPPALAAQIRNQLPRAPQRQPGWHLPRWAQFGPALAAVFFAAWVGVLYLNPPDATLAQALLDSHVRSLMASHLTDVASSDHHTVKPWFNGKLDFSPPVADLAAQGFPLLGGRLDYVERHPVAALVYQRRRHLINVFIWPNSGKPNPPSAPLTEQGYHLLHWQHGGMNYWAVSDLDLPELQQFVAGVQAIPGT
jgi:anti-sigma factor RsiW